VLANCDPFEERQLWQRPSAAPGARIRSISTGAETAGPGRSRVGWKPDGRRDRITVRGRTKTEVKDKLRTKHTELAGGIRTPANYTVGLCLRDWLGTLNTQAGSTVTGYRITVRHLIELIGTVKLVELKVREVDGTSCTHISGILSSGMRSPIMWPRAAP
jgi:hypothetical protein